MRFLAPKYLLTLLSAALILWVFNWEQERTLGPPLSRAHAQEQDLVQSGGCQSCHGSGEGTAGMLQACIDCHDGIGQDLELARGLHGAQVEGGVDDCTRCHIEHAGRDFPLVSEASFLEAGFESVEAYHHDGLAGEESRFGLNGAHDELTCVECHEHGEAQLLEKGTLRYRGLSQACDSCHDDPHEGTMVRDCAECHGQTEKFELHALYQHPESFPLVAAHGEQECTQCHEKDSAYSIEAVAGANPPADRTCGDCHEHRHTDPFLGKAGALAQVLGLMPQDAVQCKTCHDPEHPGFATALEHMPEELHAASGLELVAPHAELECKECHFEPSDPPQPDADWLRRFPGRAAADCEACHEDPHGGQFDDPGSKTQGCLQCHSEDHFVPTSFGFDAHGDTDFPLFDKHRSVACQACHEVPDGKPASARLWRGVKGDCADCHGDAHGGAFDGPEVPASLLGKQGCARCHDTTGFDGIVQDTFDHGTFTGFDLGGAHGKAECEACHTPAQSPDEFARFFGRIETKWAAAWQEDKACSLCHADPHDGAFDGADLPAVENGRRDCARCHTDTDWKSLHSETFDHRFWTGYDLPGAHARADCETCHLPTETPDALGRSFGRIEAMHGTADPSCDQCHPDPHFAIFDGPDLPVQVDGQASCARCHGLESFAQLLVGPPARFDHDLWTSSDTAGQA